jgi:hypothetical protein
MNRTENFFIVRSEEIVVSSDIPLRPNGHLP